MGPYVGVAVLLFFLWITIALVKMPVASDTSKAIDFKSTLRRLARNKNYVLGVIAQFFYVGAQIGVWSFTIRYVMQELNVNEEQASNYYLAALVLFTLSRFISTFLMKFVSPGKLLIIASSLAAICTFIVITSNGVIGVYALIAISGSMSLMFPTIFGLASRGLGVDTKLGGSGLIMAILGGAVLTAVQGQVSDMTGSINMAFIVPLLCFGVVIIFGVVAKKPAIENV
jgi:FHS family L-fucose permease-like MFS transporter